jgi:STE24 endopeptidase
MRTLLKVGLVLAAVAVTAAVVVTARGAQRETATQVTGSERPGVDDSRFEVRITDEMIRHSRIRDTLYFAGIAYSAAVLVLLLFSGLSRRIRDLAARGTKKPFVMAMIYIAIFTVAVALLEFPLSYYSGFMVPHQFNLTDQSFVSWMGDQLKGLGVGILMGAPLGALALLGIRSVRRWWFALWLGSLPIMLLMIVIQPIVLDPIFNKFEPLEDQQLRQKLVDLASRAGIEGGRVYQVNKSKQTTTMNAYVNGIGPTNRIVMWDTLLAKLDEDEVLAVMGHEMGHYVMNHIWKGFGFTAALAFVILFVGQKLHDGGAARWGPRWGFVERGDPASIPLLLLIGSLLAFLLSPVISGYSRTMENQADMFALELTHLNEPMATAFIKFAEDSKRDPRPHPFVKFWRYSHPPISERIPFALSYRPWETGEPNRFWSEEVKSEE